MPTVPVVIDSIGSEPRRSLVVSSDSHPPARNSLNIIRDLERALGNVTPFDLMAHFGAILIAPSRGIVSPFKIGVARMASTI